MIDTVRASVTSAGVRVVSARLPFAQSVALSIAVEVGSRDEPAHLSGISHFLEHMAFKGTPRRGQKEIANAVEDLGGYINACTGEEETLFIAEGMGEDLPLFVDVLTDVVNHSTLPEEQIDLERGVILQEIAQRHDDPGATAWEAMRRAAFGWNEPLGQPVIGFPGTVERIGWPALVAWMEQRYRAPAVTVAAAGNVRHAQLHELVELAEWRCKTPLTLRQAPEYRGGSVVDLGSFEQATITVGFAAEGARSPDETALSVGMSAFGSACSSPLFQKLREEMGCVYHCAAISHMLTDVGLVGFSLGCAAERAGEATGAALDLLREFAEKPDPAAVGRALRWRRNDLRTAPERPRDLVDAMLADVAVFGRVRSLEERLAALDRVDAGEVGRVLRHALDGKPSLGVTGAGEASAAVEKACGL